MTGKGKGLRVYDHKELAIQLHEKGIPYKPFVVRPSNNIFFQYPRQTDVKYLTSFYMIR